MPVVSISVGDDDDEVEGMAVAVLLTRAALIAATEAEAPPAVLDHLLDALRAFEGTDNDADG